MRSSATNASFHGVLEEAGFAVSDVVQSRMYLTDIGHWQDAAGAHGRFFGEVRPAFTLLHVLPFPEKAMRVAIEVLACKAA
ncbi:Rid family hydrolase [Burkholderia anthina]|uniref:Rid family hydrolase n=1 Tax=Burkholderia anthina TaxID=179879 RepID=UPI00158B78B3|nr:Rid family hydrolase [Burkholderia anthina]